MNLFAYCGNNPVNRVDPTGEFWITVGIMAMGGLIGAAVGAVSSIITQKALTGTVNWKSVGVAAATGLVSGAIAASPLGVVGQAIAGGVIGGLSYAADCYVNDEAIELDDAVASVFIGTVFGYLGGPGANEGQVLTNTIRSAKETVAREVRRANQRYAQKVILSTMTYRNNILRSAALKGGVGFATSNITTDMSTKMFGAFELFPNAPAWKFW